VAVETDAGVVIRPYGPDDWAAIRRIHDAARLLELRLTVGEAAFLGLDKTAESEGLFDAALDAIEVEGRVRGFVAYSALELTWLYVDPEVHRAGLGRRLLRHAIQRAGPVFRTEVLEGNAPALRLYLSEGFVVAERKVGRLEGNESFPAAGLLLERRAPSSPND
jgi:GNAT superfamily N-acetyltransferase